MNAREFLNEFGSGEAARVALRADTNLDYFRQLACGFRRPSFELAERLVTASEGKLDILALMREKDEWQQAKQATNNAAGQAA